MRSKFYLTLIAVIISCLSKAQTANSSLITGVVDDNAQKIVGEWQIKEVKVNDKPTNVCSYCDLYKSGGKINFLKDGSIEYGGLPTEVKYRIAGNQFIFTNAEGVSLAHTFVLSDANFFFTVTVDSNKEEYTLSR
jgi:hypothetical protein